MHEAKEVLRIKLPADKNATLPCIQAKKRSTNQRLAYRRSRRPSCVARLLAGGFLTGKYRSKADLGKSAARGGSVAKYLDGKGPTVLSALDEVAGATAATPKTGAKVGIA